MRSVKYLILASVFFVACDNPFADPTIEESDVIVIVLNIKKNVCTSGHIREIVTPSSADYSNSAVVDGEKSCPDYGRSEGSRCKLYSGLEDPEAEGDFTCIVGYGTIGS